MGVVQGTSQEGGDPGGKLENPGLRVVLVAGVPDGLLRVPVDPVQGASEEILRVVVELLPSIFLILGERPLDPGPQEPPLGEDPVLRGAQRKDEPPEATASRVVRPLGTVKRLPPSPGIGSSPSRSRI